MYARKCKLLQLLRNELPVEGTWGLGPGSSDGAEVVYGFSFFGHMKSISDSKLFCNMLGGDNGFIFFPCFL